VAKRLFTVDMENTTYESPTNLETDAGSPRGRFNVGEGWLRRVNRQGKQSDKPPRGGEANGRRKDRTQGNEEDDVKERLDHYASTVGVAAREGDKATRCSEASRRGERGSTGR
jgi:hypothetical protein